MLKDVGINFASQGTGSRPRARALWYDTYDRRDHKLGPRVQGSEPGVFLLSNLGLVGGQANDKSTGENAFGIHLQYPEFYHGDLEEGAAIVDSGRARQVLPGLHGERGCGTSCPWTSIKEDGKGEDPAQQVPDADLGGRSQALQGTADMEIYPIHAGRDDNWLYHMEQWNIRQ